MDLEAHKKRLRTMLAIVSGAFLVAMGAIYLSFRTHAIWATGLFVLALLVGFGAQGWMIWSWKKAQSQGEGGV